MALTAVISLLAGGAAGAGAAGLLDNLDSAADPVPSSTPAEPTAGADPAGQESSTPVPDGTDITEVAAAVLPSTVTIQVRNSGQSSSGSGVVLDDQGHILTNNHVIEGGSGGGRVEVVFSDGNRVRAAITGRSPSYDLAVIKVDAGDHLKPATIGDSSTVRTGQTAIAVGSPLGLGGSVTSGIVSSLDRPVRVGDSSSADAAVAYINGIQTDAAINPGNSGGPLVDAAGRVIGINSAILTLGDGPQSGSIGVGFAIPINQAMVIVDELRRNGEARYPVIGAQVRDTTDESGVSLVEITDGGPAAGAGLRVGDKVTAVDGHQVYGSTEMIVRIRTHRPGDVVDLDYVRDGSTSSVKLTLDGRVG